jgi:GNAT superfamily N-acetyltransferase
MEIREVRPDEFATAGELVVEAYEVIDPIGLGDYADELRDVAGRNTGAEVLVAVDDDGTLLGSVTYVPGPDSPSAEFTDPDSSGIRMLAVSPKAQGRGVGQALVGACVARAEAAGKHQLVLHTTDWMTTAHRLYGRLGFVRAEELDWQPGRDEIPEAFWLRGFRLRLDGAGKADVHRAG